MLTTYFTCEKCGQQWDLADKKFPGRVNVAVRLNFNDDRHTFPTSATGYDCRDTLSANWCKACVEKCGVLTPSESHAAKEARLKLNPAPAPTTEEIIVGLLESLGFTREH